LRKRKRAIKKMQPLTMDGRTQVEEAFLKSTHAARAEAAAARREEKRRAEKERILLRTTPRSSASGRKRRTSGSPRSACPK